MCAQFYQMGGEQSEEWQERVSALRTKYDDLRDELGFSDVTGQLGDIATEIAGLPAAIEQLRQRGYAFAGYLERKAEVLGEQWDEVRQQVQEMADREVERAQRQGKELEMLWRRVENPSGDREKAAKLFETAVDSAMEAIEGARERIEGLYGNVPNNVSQTKAQIAELNGYLDLAEESAVDWLPTEAVFLANKAEWVRTGKGKKDPDGILFLTDQRLIFERKEKVGGRFGFGGEKVQEVLFSAPIGTIGEVKAEKKGLLGGKDMIHLKLSEGDYDEMTLEVKGGVDADWYAQQMNRAIRGELDAERAIPVDKEAQEAVRNAPTSCPTCGATLPSPVRGMAELKCEYCGTVVRL